MPTITTSTIISNIYRVGAWFQLRVLPIPQFHIVLFTLYGIYAILWLNDPLPEESVPIKVLELKEDAEQDKKANGTNGVAHPESIVIKRAGPDPVPTPARLLFSLPSKYPLVRYGNMAINTVTFFLTIFATYQLYLPSYNQDNLTFARIGATYSDAVKIHLRYPGLDEDSVTHRGVGALKVLWREAVDQMDESIVGMWKDGPVVQLNEENDWVGVAHLTKLWPGRSYQFRLAYPNSTFLPYPSTPLKFETFPDPRLRTGHKFNFAVSSGLHATFPFVPRLNLHELQIQGFDILHQTLFSTPKSSLEVTTVEVEAVPTSDEQLESPITHHKAQHVVNAAPGDLPDEEIVETKVPGHAPLASFESFLSFLKLDWLKKTTTQDSTVVTPPNFMLLIGDMLQHYAPLPFKTAEVDYLKAFRNVYASPSFRQIYEKLPIFHVLAPSVEHGPDLWKSSVAGGKIPESAIPAYETYAQSANYPGQSREYGYFDFKYGDSAFFVLDTSTPRSLLEAAEEERTLLGIKQLNDLSIWASKVNHTSIFKFVVSPIPFSAMWGQTPQGRSWDHFPEERRHVLELLSFMPNTIIISGDRHEFAAVEYLDGRLFEFVTGPLNSYAVAELFSQFSEKNANSWVVTENVTATTPSEGFGIEGEPVVLTTTKVVYEERCLKHVAEGQHKWSTFDVDTTNAEKPTLTVTLFVNGARSWSSIIEGRQLPYSKTSAVGMVLTGGIKSVLSRMGFGRLTGNRS